MSDEKNFSAGLVGIFHEIITTEWNNASRFSWFASQ
jgi:hypothetical protein